MKFPSGMSTVLLAATLVGTLLCADAHAQGEKAKQKAREKIQQTYREVLGRDASKEDIEHHMKRLEGGMKPMEMRRSIVMSEEGTQAIKRVFKEVLGREPNKKQLNQARAGLSEGQALQDLRRTLKN